VSRVPIRLKVTAAFAIAMAAVLAGSGLFLYLRLSSHLAASLDRELRVRWQDLAALVSDPRATLSRDSRSRFIERGESYAQLVSQSGDVLDATEPLGGDPLLSAHERMAAQRAPIYIDVSRVPGLDEGSRVLAARVAHRGRPAVLVVGATRQDDAETLAGFRNELLIAGPIALILASGVGYLLAGISLQQVESMRGRASLISAERPGDRLPVPPTGDEVQRLGETLNEMLDRLEAALEREQDFVADAGHELRTPLALLRTELELALHQAQTTDELREAVRRSSYEADRLSQLAEDLLVIARADRRGRLPLRREPVEVDALFAAVSTRFEWRAAELGKALMSTPAGGLHLAADRMRLEQALGNLVDNALRHGGDRVTLAAVATDGRLELHVRDNGTGFPAEFLARAFDRFTRVDVARGGGSSGLGLSIVKTIAESHDGTAHVANAAPGGADTWVSLPAADA
jgi:two-component system, OmpR family, sensor kinase